MNEPTRTVIGEKTTINGNLEGDEDLLVQGRIEGSISLKHTLTIEPAGVVQAEVQVLNAVISGVMVGNISAEESVHITAQGRMVGDINAPRVIIVDGASFRGNVDMGNLDMPRPKEGESRPARPAPAGFRPALTRPKPEASKASEADTLPPPKPAAPQRPVLSAREAEKPGPGKTKEPQTTPRKAPPPKAPLIGKRRALRRR